MRSKAGYEYENQLALDIFRYTNGGLVPLTTRSSGNVSIPLPDIVFDDGETVHAMEIKRTSGDKVTFESEYDEELPTDDLHQLLLYAQLYPRSVNLYLGAKFPYRQLVTTRLWPDESNHGTKTISEFLEEATVLCPVECNHTYTDNFVIYKPDTDQWPSSEKGDEIEHIGDVEHVLDVIGYNQPVS